MQKQSIKENRYCNQCRKTTRHEVKDQAHACLFCGTLKYPPQNLQRTMQPAALSA